MRPLLIPILWLLSAASLHAATGSAETGDVTVDTRSDNANLSALASSPGTFSPAFAVAITDYNASVANAPSVTVTPTSAEINATIEVRVNSGSFVSVTSGSPSGALALNVGSNAVDVRVTAQDGATQKTYTITVARLTPPTVVDTTIADVSATGATLGGDVAADGGAAIVERGVVYSAAESNDTPVLNGPGVNKVTVIGTTGAFSAPVTSLASGTVYACRTYATNSEGTGYSDVTMFLTDTVVDFTDGLEPVYPRSILPGDRQIFTFSLTGPRIVSLSTTGGAPLRAELRDASGNLLAIFAGDGNFDLNEVLFPGAYKLEVSREDGVGPAGNYVLTIDASEVAETRPDVAVGASAAALSGQGVYLPSGQTASVTSVRSKPVNAFAELSNQGNLPDVLSVRATDGNAFFRVTYLGPEGNITVALLTGTYQSPELTSGDGGRSVQTIVSPNKKKLTKKMGKRSRILSKSHPLTITATSTFDSAIVDAATIQVRTK